jgi:hypothetical protein
MEQVISRMMRSHVGLLDSLLEKLRFVGAPAACTRPLHEMKSRAELRGREYYNQPALFKEVQLAIGSNAMAPRLCLESHVVLADVFADVLG